MDSAARKALCDELRRLIESGPGSSQHSLQRVRNVVSELEPGKNASVREKASVVLEDFALWFSEGRWHRYGDPQDFRMRLLTAIENFETSFRDDPQQG